MDVTAIVLSYKRIPNIDKVISSLLNNTVKPKSVVLINNNPEVQLEGYPATIVNCGKNFGCPVRHALGLLVDTSHCLFQDDDLWLEPGAISNFIEWGKKFPEAILGYFGKQIKGNSYSMGAEVHTKHIKTATKVAVVKGRVHFCKKEKLIQPFNLLRKLLDYPSGEDDILLSLSNIYYGHMNYVIPSKTSSAYHELSERGVARYKRKHHWGLRDQAVRSVLKLGVKL